MKRLVWPSCIACALCMCQLIFSAEQPMPEPVHANSPITSTLYLRNCSKYIVRVSVGPEYPNCIAIFPGCTVEFPLQKVVEIQASSYGLYASFIRNLFVGSGKLYLKTVLNEHPEFYDHDCFVDITLDKDALHFKQGYWKLAVVTLGPDDTKEVVDSEAQRNALYQILKQGSLLSNQIARDAAIVWSLFPRVAEKLLKNEPYFPYNVLGLDIGGAMPTDDQLANWAELLLSTAQKRFGPIVHSGIMNVAKLLIVDNIELIKQKDFKHVNNASNFAAMLLRLNDLDVRLTQQQDGMDEQKLLQQLKEKFKDNPEAKELVDKFESEVKALELPASNESLSPIAPPPPPPPPMPPMGKGIFQEQSINDFLTQFEATVPEARTPFDTATHSLFTLIDSVGKDPKKIVQLKGATLCRLSTLSKQEKSTQNLSKIQKYVSAAMIQLAYENSNPIDHLNKWISYVINATKSKARECSKKNADELRKIRQDELKAQDLQAQLFESLRAVMEQRRQKIKDSELDKELEDFE